MLLLGERHIKPTCFTERRILSCHPRSFTILEDMHFTLTTLTAMGISLLVTVVALPKYMSEPAAKGKENLSVEAR
jgi:hypothetical protein